MKDSTKIMIGIWLLVGLPLGYVVNWWTSEWWIPLPVPLGEGTSYYVTWAIAFSLIYLLPALLLFRALVYLFNRPRRENRR